MEELPKKCLRRCINAEEKEDEKSGYCKVYGEGQFVYRPVQRSEVPAAALSGASPGGHDGDRGSHPKENSLSEEFFKERYSAVDVTVKILYGTVDPKRTDGEDIIGQYVFFTKVYNEQVRLYGRTTEAVSETIRICMDRDILKEYLASRKKEVITMMMNLYDQDRILEIHIASEKKIAADEAAKKAEDATIQRMLKKGKFSIQEIAECLAVSTDRVREIEAGMLQEA